VKPFLSTVTAPAQENHPIAVPVASIVKRQLEGAINSDASPGGYVRPEQFTALKRAGAA
jgi:hypothetical protein